MIRRATIIRIKLLHSEYFMINFSGRHFQKDMILQSIRWYLTYALSYRDVEELMEERGYSVDHSAINRWVIYYSPKLEKVFRQKKICTGKRWRLDETYIKVKGQWKYFYRAVDKQNNTIGFLLTAKRDRKAALRFFNKAVCNNGQPSLVNIDKSGTNKAAINTYNEDNNTRIKIRQCKYLNNIVEQDHRFVKQLTRPMLGCRNFQCAQKTLAGIELVRMIKKGQYRYSVRGKQSPAELFYSLAA